MSTDSRLALYSQPTRLTLPQRGTFRYDGAGVILPGGRSA